MHLITDQKDPLISYKVRQSDTKKVPAAYQAITMATSFDWLDVGRLYLDER